MKNFFYIPFLLFLLFSGSLYSLPPIIGNIPDIWISDYNENQIAGEDINFFRFSDAFNFDLYVSRLPDDPDQSTTNIRWCFLAESENLLTINGINTISDPSQAITPELFGKELTGYPNNNQPFPRESSLATFWDILDSPPGAGPPWLDPVAGFELDTIITIYCSNGAELDSTQIHVKANDNGPPNPPPNYTIWQYYAPAYEGWLPLTDILPPIGHKNLPNPREPFTDIADHITSGSSVGIVGSIDKNVYGMWQSPSTDVEYTENSLYIVKYKIRSTQTDVKKVPNCRLFTQFIGTGILGVSAGNRIGRGLFAPDPDGEIYPVFVEPPNLAGSGATHLKFTFELADCDVNEEGILLLDEVVIDRLPTPSKNLGTLVKSYITPSEFASEGWEPFVLGSPFGDATVGLDSTGLFITTPKTVAAQIGWIDYGMWQLPASPSTPSFESWKLYRCVYTLQSSDSSTLGKIRLINASAGGDWSSQIALLSDQIQLHLPDADGGEYSNWFATMPDFYTGDESYKNQMSFMFDVSDGRDVQEGTVHLTRVELYSYELGLYYHPWSPYHW